MTLPTGTLTLLFSDIEGSTALLHRLGERWGEALSAQRSLLRQAFEAHDGTEMGTEGDSFFVVFRSAHEAIRAAVDGQRALQTHEWPGGVRACGCGWGCTPVSRSGTRTATSARTCTGPPGSARRPTAGRRSCPTRRGRSSTTSRPSWRSATSAGTG